MPPATDLAFIERQLEKLDTDMREMRGSMSMLVAVNERQTALLERMNGVQGAVNDHEQRLRAIELHLPQLRETRGWLVTACASAASAILALALNHAAALYTKPPLNTRATVEESERRTTTTIR